MVDRLPFMLAQVQDNDWIMGVVFFGGGTLVLMTWIILSQVRRIVEARHRGGNPELAQWVDANARQTHAEIQALKSEVAHLKEVVNDLVLQSEFSRPSTQDVSERLTPPEFKQRV